MLHSEADRLANTCRDFLITLRHYTVGRADSGQLLLLPRKHVLRTTPLDGCVEDAQCTVLANYAAKAAIASNPLTNLMPTDPHTWTCMTDDARAAVNTDPLLNKRCVETCAFHSKETDGKDRDADCELGTICQGATQTPAARGICMEGVTPPQSCVNGPQRFEVHASEAFTLIGTFSGYIHPIVKDNDSTTCIQNKTANPVQRGRIPLKAPACNPAADPITGQVGTGFEDNPCSLLAPQTEFVPNYVLPLDPITCLRHPTDPLDTELSTKIVDRLAPAIKLRSRSMTLTLVDPYYPGDMSCLLDRQGGVPGIGPGDRVPLVFPGYQVSFTQTGGFSPLQITGTSFPVKVVRGPNDSIWVMDDGDFLSTSIVQPSMRGNVYRVDPQDTTHSIQVDRIQ
jgi:hypothetical protein